MPDITVYPDNDSLVSAAADFIADSAGQAIAARGRFTLALSGGHTPRPVYARLATPGYLDRIDWTRVQVFFGDERCVPPDDTRSNYHMVKTTLFNKIPLPEENIHHIRGEETPEQAARDYARILRHTFGVDNATGGPPFEGFDLILLGMGEDGHTASIFPGLVAVTESVAWVLAQYVEVMAMWRLTLTPVVINAARRVAFLVSGDKKAETLRQVLEGPYQPVVLPAQAIKPTRGELHWLVDGPAAARLRRES